MDNDTSEITKLTERISKDPKSKLFVPLAEEYKKMGDIEMSIHVLKEGLKNNPGYVTAKSFLGRLLLEKGDLKAAQKEFEEVVKAIPDNLLAQRKLGDIYALLGNAGNALAHYETVLSLNPGDEETASLVSDLEAGRSVKERLFKPKPQPTPEQAGKSKPGSAVSSAPPARPAVGGTQAAPKEAPKPARGEAEEPEEVLVVEPLEPETPKRSEIPGGYDFLAETGPQPTPVVEEQPSGFFELSEQSRVPPVEPSITSSGEAMGNLAAEKAEGAGRKASVTAPAAADDFTTNTLAELYISQGFYEKAIDIYERMLAENPGSRAIRDKLTQVRALAGQTAAPAEEPKTDVRFESMAYQPPGFGRQEGSEEKAQPVPASIPAGRKQTIDRLEHWLKNIMREKK